MSIVVVGGHSRSVGKTSVVAGLIAALPERRWTAIKITQYGHGVCSTNGETCGCAVDEHTWAITPEADRSGKSDTSRFLVAGAERSIWVRTKQGMLAEAMPDLRRILGESENTIVESNSLMRFVRPDLYLTVLDFATEDFKNSAREFLDQASAVILHESARDGEPARWQNVSLKPAAGKPTFYVRPPEYCTREMVEFVRERLAHPAELQK
jgi:molybdopterin-guanine dinucleotide biosynthesis protein